MSMQMYLLGKTWANALTPGASIAQKTSARLYNLGALQASSHEGTLTIAPPQPNVIVHEFASWENYSGLHSFILENCCEDHDGGKEIALGLQDVHVILLGLKNGDVCRMNHGQSHSRIEAARVFKAAAVWMTADAGKLRTISYNAVPVHTQLLEWLTKIGDEA